MNVNIIYGDEVLTEGFLARLGEQGFSIDSLLNGGPDNAADRFIDAVMQMDYLVEDDNEYYSNIGRLCLDLSKKYPIFHKKVTEGVQSLDAETVPSRAALVLYGI
jgi:hypothetical protein